MNIFQVDNNPVIAAQSLVDRHVVKMILETAQLLSTAHRILDGELYVDSSTGRRIKRYKLYDGRETVLYKATHAMHPSAVWCRESVKNYLWLVDHFAALLDEYTYRYNKRHKCTDLLYTLQSPPFNLKEYESTTMRCAMPDMYKISANPVINYREYYKNGKKHLFKFTKRQPPEWIYE
jgi:hypothetical protein